MKIRLTYLLLPLYLILFVSCSREENPYRRELQALMHENAQLREQLGKLVEDQREVMRELESAELSGQTAKERADVLEVETVRLRKQVDDLNRKNGQLTTELNVLREQQEQVRTEREESVRLAEEKRRSQLDAIAAANRVGTAQPPFRVFDVMFVGKKTVNGRTDDYGRFSVRNYTDKALNVTAWYKLWPISFIVPPNSVTNGVWIKAEKGDTFKVKANDHEEAATW